MIYRLPEIRDEEILRDYIREHFENGETDVTASMELASSDYQEWVEKICRNALSGGEDWGRSLLYLCFDGARLVGLLSVRYELPERLSRIYGDIGYGVRPSERRKGYATGMLGYGLSVCREKGLRRVILGCYKDNTASAATIRRNGGVLIEENENYTKGRRSQYYEIKLQDAVPGRDTEDTAGGALPVHAHMENCGKQLRRIAHYEGLLDELRQAVSDSASAEELSALREKAGELGLYYGSSDWKKDFADDEAGRLPKDLKRGVLSEDGIYNALEAFRERLEEAGE